MWVRPLGQEDPLKESMATQSSNLAWRIPWTEESGRLQSIGLQSQMLLKRFRVHTHTHTHIPSVMHMRVCACVSA